MPNSFDPWNRIGRLERPLMRTVCSNPGRHLARRKGSNLTTTVSSAESLVLWLLVIVSSLNVCAQTASNGALDGHGYRS